MSKNLNPSQLDPGQIVKRAFDDANDRIRVDANITAPDGTSILIDADTDSIKIGNATAGPFLNVNSDGSVNSRNASDSYARYVDSVDATLMYVGEATAGSSVASSVWRIKRLTFSDDNVTIIWAGGNANFSNVWNNRAGLSYS